jgi:hypothetical protein
VTTFCRQHDFLREIEKQTELSDAEKLRRIILELVDTEKNYLKVWGNYEKPSYYSVSMKAFST